VDQMSEGGEGRTEIVCFEVVPVVPTLPENVPYCSNWLFLQDFHHVELGGLTLITEERNCV